MRSRKIIKSGKNKTGKNKTGKNKSHKGYKGKSKSSKRTRRQRKRHYFVPVFTKQTESIEDSGTLYEKEKEKHNSGNIIKGMRDFLNKKRGFVL